MASQYITRIRLQSSIISQSASQHRRLHSSIVTLPPHHVANTHSNVNNAFDILQEQRFADLSDVLSRRGNPSRVWTYYVHALNSVGYEKLPLEIHQDVLRKCTPPSAELRIAAARRLIAGNKPSNPHIHEGRFQMIIRNIRGLGVKPTLDDYHFILEQFVAVGHHTGAMHVYKEALYLGIKPRTKTFGLCLQAIAHRLALPCSPLNRSRVHVQARKMFADLLNDMQKYDIRLTSVNLDLAIRILKESADKEGFEMLLRIGYGIDLAHPDRPPLEPLDIRSIGTKLGRQVQAKLPVPQPFSTAALNTTLDMLGRLGDVSKLVQAFEVFTQPLPPHAGQHFSSSFDDDEDFGFSAAQKFQLPHAEPNTTTYNTLLKYVSRGGHAVFARHYILQAMELEWKTDRALRGELMRKPLAGILAPHFAINRGTLLSAFGEANRDKNLGLMRWLKKKLPKIIRRKEQQLSFYTEFRDKIRSEDREIASDPSITILGAPSLQTFISRVNTPPINQSSTTNSATAFLPSVSPAGRLPPLARRERLKYTPTYPEFEVDFDSPPVPPPLPIKYFDIDLHLRILERDRAEIRAFAIHLLNVLGRTTQRVKERLGRRVWSGKDIYILSEGKRVRMTRQRWQEIVCFKPRRGFYPTITSESILRAGETRPSDGYIRRSRTVNLPKEGA